MCFCVWPYFDVVVLFAVTLLNLDYYNERIKPSIAEWAYLWLQKQHFHGINHIEAVHYILNGAMKRRDVSERLHIINEAMGKSSEPSPDEPRLREAAVQSGRHQQLVRLSDPL